MSFLFPLGLIGLIGVPIVIIIYIIKNKYTEQTITSTYLWKLSEKFLPKRKPISALSGLICLIMQIIAIITISLLIAQPRIRIPNVAKEYCFIIDASGSMNMVSNDQTRLELGKDEVEKVILSSTNGSKYTLVSVGNEAEVIYEKISDKEKAVELLNKVEPTGVTVDFTDTVKYVQRYFNENNSLETYLVTDKEYNSKNIKVINVSSHEENYAILDTKQEIVNNKLEISGNVISYENDALINVYIYMDDVLKMTFDLEAKKMEKVSFNYDTNNLDYNTIKIVINNKDSLSLDNEKIIYNVQKEQQSKVLLVSNRPFYILSALETVGNCNVTVVGTDSYDSNVSGYDLYIYDAASPERLPDDGTVWLFGAPYSIDGSGFSVQDEVVNEDGMELTYAKNSSSTFKLFTNNLTKEKIVIAKYIKYGLYKKFTTLLTHNGQPIVFTGLTESGNREVVFAFDLHDSNLPLLMDYLTLTKNLLDYSFPVVIEESTYMCGDSINVNILSGCKSATVTSPSGKITYLDVTSEFSEYRLTEVGSYKVKLTIGDNEKEYSIYASLPSEESEVDEEVYELSLDGELGNDYLDGIYDKVLIYFIILLIVFMADWVVYCYEQYQIR